MDTENESRDRHSEGNSSGDEFISLLHSLHRELRRYGAGAEVAPGQLRMLRAVARQGEPVRLGQLAAQLDIAPRSATAKVDAAVRDGLMIRNADPADRRAALIALTPKAHDILVQAHSARGTAADTLLQELTVAEQQELLHLLRRIGRSPAAEARSEPDTRTEPETQPESRLRTEPQPKTEPAGSGSEK